MTAAFVVWGFAIGRISGKSRTRSSNRFLVDPDEIGAAVDEIVNELMEYFGNALDVIEISGRFSTDARLARPYRPKGKGLKNPTA